MEPADKSYQLLACRYLQSQLEVIVDKLDGVRSNPDIDCVHALRVGSRRTRAALRMFADCFERKKLKSWRKQIRKLTKGLGAARDKDVQIEFVNGLLENLNEDEGVYRPGLERLLLRLGQHRKSVQPQVINVLDELEASDMLVEMHCEIERVLFGTRQAKIDVQSPFVFQQCHNYITEHYDTLMAHCPSLDDEHDKDGHHQMRVAAKKLRYVLEICNPAYEKRLSASIKTAKKLQSLLGDIHDCDVWLEYIPQFIQDERQRTLDYCGELSPFEQIEPGLKYLSEERQECRDKTFDELTAYWEKAKDKRIWENMFSLIKACIE